MPSFYLSNSSSSTLVCSRFSISFTSKVKSELTNNTLLAFNLSAIFVRGTVGDKARLAVLRLGQRADLVGDGLAEVIGVLRGVGDDVAFLERGGIDLFDQNEVACIEIGLAHRIRQDDERLVPEQRTVRTVERGHGHDREDHHAHGDRHDQPDEDAADHF